MGEQRERGLILIFKNPSKSLFFLYFFFQIFAKGDRGERKCDVREKREKKDEDKREQFCHFKRKANVSELSLTCVKEIAMSMFFDNNLDKVRLRYIIETNYKDM